MTDLSSEDEVASSSGIYYFTDEDGNIHSREFLAEELIPDESHVLHFKTFSAHVRDPSQLVTDLRGLTYPF